MSAVRAMVRPLILRLGVGGAAPPDEGGAELVSINVTPDTPAALEVDDTLQMTATGTYDDTMEDDLTAAASWSSSNEAVATVVAGLVTAIGAGTATITAEFDGIQGTEDVEVEAAPSRATIALTHVTTGASTTDGTTFNSASFTPVVGQVYFVATAPTGVAQGATLNHDGFAGGFTLVGSSRIGATTRQVNVYRGVCTSAVADTVTQTYASSQTSVLWSIVTGTGIDTGGTNGANAVVQFDDANSNVGVTTLNTTLAALEYAGNVNLTFVMLGGNSSVTPDTQFAELGDIGITAATGTLESEWATGEVTCDPSWASTTVCMFSLEVKAATV